MEVLKVMLDKTITVQVLKYDGTEYRRWTGRVARREDSLLVLNAEFETEVRHDALGTVPKGTKLFEYYWFDRWYNVFQFLNEEGGTRLYYCNVNMPPTLDNDVLIYVDLDIDLIVQPNLSYQIFDLEEFEAHAASFGYSPELKDRVHAAIDELISLIQNRQFPFDESDSGVGQSSA